MTTLILDNYDSFVFNLAQLFGALGAEPKVLRADALDLEAVRALAPRRIVISPGPGTPTDPAYFGVCAAVIAELEVPILGVCLGHQGIGAAWGARVVPAPRVMHGKLSQIHHTRSGLFAGLPSPFVAMRYHSLVLAPESLPSSLRVTAHSDDGVIMALEHATRPQWGLQFHPESIGTAHGSRLIANFLHLSSGK